MLFCSKVSVQVPLGTLFRSLRFL